MASPTVLNWGPLTVAGDGSSLFNLISLVGWRGDLPPARFDQDGRLNAHGEFDGPVWASARTVSLVGECRTKNQRDTLLSMLAGASGLPGSGAASTLTVQEAGLTLTAAAKMIRAGKTRDVGSWGLGFFQFQIDWRCPDPMLYGPLQSVGPLVQAPPSGGLTFPLFAPSGVMSWGTLPTPQSAALTNPGSADSQTLLTVAAGASAVTGGFQVIEASTGQILRYADDLGAGQYVVFNSADGSVLLNGDTDRRGSVTVAQWTSIPPGATRTLLLALLSGTSTTASLTASTRPTYW